VKHAFVPRSAATATAVLLGSILFGCGAGGAARPPGVAAPASVERAVTGDAGGAATPPLEAAPALPIPRPALDAPAFVTSTRYVEDLLSFGGSLWVATRGGLERYALDGFEHQYKYTTRDGLDSVRVVELAVSDGRVVARTERRRCVLDEASFVCEPAGALRPKPLFGDQFAGSRVTRRLDAGDVEVIGTASKGAWVVPSKTSHALSKRARRLTRDAQLLDGFVTSVAEHDGELYVGTFNGGLAVTESSPRAAAFETAEFRDLDGPRRINALESTPHGLFVAAGEGLFVLSSGHEIERVQAVTARGVNGLAFDGRHLFVTAPGALFRVPLARGSKPGTWWKPGGSRAVQGVALAGTALWLATEDRGAVRFDGTSFMTYDRARGLPSSWVISVDAHANGSVLLATLRDGVIALGADGSYESLAGLPSPWALAVHVDGGGAWIGTQAGGVWANGSGSTTALSPLPDPRVHSVLTLGEHVLLGTELGLAVFPRRADD